MLLYDDILKQDVYIHDSHPRFGYDYHLCYDYLLREYLVVEFKRNKDGSSKSKLECISMFGGIQVLEMFYIF